MTGPGPGPGAGPGAAEPEPVPEREPETVPQPPAFWDAAQMRQVGHQVADLVAD